MAEADLILNVTSFKVGCEVETGPGLISTSPARSNRQRVSREDVLWWMQSFWRVNNLGLKMKGSRSRDWHTEGGGMRGRCGCWREGSRGGCEWQWGQTNPKPMYKNKRANARTLTKWRRGSQVPKWGSRHLAVWDSVRVLETGEAIDCKGEIGGRCAKRETKNQLS